MTNKYEGMNPREVNAYLNLLGDDGQLQLDADREAARQFFLQEVNKNTVFYHSLEEKVERLTEEEYWDKRVIDQYDWDFVKGAFKHAYDLKFRFATYLGAYKFYHQYALKTYDGTRWVERFEDRVVMNALFLARGDQALVLNLIEDIISGQFQPATPTFLNAGRARRGEFSSCYLIRTEDNAESIMRNVNASAQLSKRGGGVGICITNVRELGAPIKGFEGAGAGIVPFMKVLEDTFSYFNQLGQRQGAGAVYINAHHPDIMTFLDTKRENADEKIRIKTLSLGIVIPDITFQLAKENKDMYLFSPYDVERVYGVPFSDINVSEKYDEMVLDGRIKKGKVKAREFFQTVAELQFESGYPYLMFEDTVNRENNVHGKIIMSNLCSEILQVQTPSSYNEDLSYKETGEDIVCNLGSINVAKALDNAAGFGDMIDSAVRALTVVSEDVNTASVPSIELGNSRRHAIGLGAMNLHGAMASNGILYGTEEGLDFTNAYFNAHAFYAYAASAALAIERDETFYEFEKSKYADGSAFDKYTKSDELTTVKTEAVRKIMVDKGFHVPSSEDWARLAEQIKETGLYNAYLMAIAPTGSISYVNNSTSSIHPITAQIEARKEGKLGRIYYPAYGMTTENRHLYVDAYDVGYEAVIDTYAVAQRHIDQGISCTLFYKNTHSTRDVNKAYIRAFRKGLKTLYYARIRSDALEGTEMEGCVSCTI